MPECIMCPLTLGHRYPPNLQGPVDGKAKWAKVAELVELQGYKKPKIFTLFLENRWCWLNAWCPRGVPCPGFLYRLWWASYWRCWAKECRSDRSYHRKRVLETIRWINVFKHCIGPWLLSQPVRQKNVESFRSANARRGGNRLKASECWSFLDQL